MKFFIISLALFAVVQADVSHLNREYLPPLQQKFAEATASLSSSSLSGSVGLAAPGSDSSSYQPAHLIPAELQVSQGAIEVEAQVVPGSDTSSYQPAHLIPAELQVSQGAVEAEPQIAPGSDESSYQPAQLIPAQFGAQVEVAQQAEYQVEQQVEQQVEAEVVPQAIGADTYTPEQFIPEQDRIANENYIQSTNGIEEFNPESHVPTVIGQNTITPAHLQSADVYSGVGAGADTGAGAGASVSYGSSSSYSSSGIDTQYAPGGGYVY